MRAAVLLPMSLPLQFTGERFLPGTEGEIAQEHWHRYLFARRFVSGRRVLDAACGEGYGSALLSDIASEVIGVDIDANTIAHARIRYAHDRLRFIDGSVTALPLPNASVDAIVSFETIEHVSAEDQSRMVDEFARVLAPGGFVILSSPNRPEYSEARHYVNPFHRHELDRDELAQLLDRFLPVKRWYRQQRYLGSALWGENGGDAFESFCAGEDGATETDGRVAMYFVVIAARDGESLPTEGPALSLCCDRDGREWQRIDHQAHEVLRLDAMLKDRDAALDRQTHHIRHLEQLVADRDRIVAERDRQIAAERTAAQADFARLNSEHIAEREKAQQSIAACNAECARLERAIDAQERIIAYRQSVRWWVRLPWLRIRLLWKSLAG